MPMTLEEYEYHKWLLTEDGKPELEHQSFKRIQPYDSRLTDIELQKLLDDRIAEDTSYIKKLVHVYSGWFEGKERIKT